MKEVEGRKERRKINAGRKEGRKINEGRKIKEGRTMNEGRAMKGEGIASRAAVANLWSAKQSSALMHRAAHLKMKSTVLLLLPLAGRVPKNTTKASSSPSIFVEEEGQQKTRRKELKKREGWSGADVMENK
jgi:hypothetical protein